jgi:hypothetical protein
MKIDKSWHIIYIIREEFALSLKYMNDLFIIGIFNTHIYLSCD